LVVSLFLGGMWS